ncbi:MAG: hypothetical protein JWN22_220 [Nocardioides sp.]|nr:hypothetical protein [Nocardioides sp.]
MSRLILLNGPPGIGKSTLARRYVEDHPGVLDADIDVLRTLVGGWRDDFNGVGALIRPAALALIGAYLAGGNDVVLPQMLTNPSELARFEAAALGAGAEFVECLLIDDLDASVARFHLRGTSDPDVEWHSQVRLIVESGGGDELLAAYHGKLLEMAETRPSTIVVRSAEGDVGGTYASLRSALAES